ncbi:Arginine/agmatine antiporter [Raoultella ornithinolytica]|nr:Arginine/agmatine antiporter [Raoultella ornithinolytica]
MGTVSSGSAHKMGVIALTLVTASNMMGSGVFMLPTNLAGIGSISIWGWVFTIIGVIALALVFAKTSLITPRTGGIVAYASDAFGPFIGFQTTICYWISAWVGNVALLVAGVGYLSFFFPELKKPGLWLYRCHYYFVGICIPCEFRCQGRRSGTVLHRNLWPCRYFRRGPGGLVLV